MKKPNEYDIKLWLYNNAVNGFRLKRKQAGDDSETYWELYSANGGTRTILGCLVKPLVDINPDWNRILNLRVVYQREVTDYLEFEEANADDLEEYKRLKAKFE